MHSVAVFPWLTIPQDARFGRFKLVPFERAKAPFGAGTDEQATLDTVLDAYHWKRGCPIQTATLVALDEHGPLAHLQEGDRTDAFKFGKLVMASGLSARAFFQHDPSRYSNAQTFDLHVTDFDESGGLGIPLRRRDWEALDGRTLATNLVQRPNEAHMLKARPNDALSPIDTRLLDALVSASACRHWKFDGGVPGRGKAKNWALWPKVWPRVEEAIRQFGLANTDSPSMLGDWELVQQCGAFERLLRPLGQTAPAFATAVNAWLSWNAESTPEPDGVDAGESCLYAWAYDFYMNRGSPAHGELEMSPDKLEKQHWDLREHLLLASHLFPLTLKAVLRRCGHYECSDHDHAEIAAIDCRLHCNPLAPLPSIPNDIDDDAERKNRHPWNLCIKRKPPISESNLALLESDLALLLEE